MKEENQRIVLYVMSDKKKPDGHPFLVGHRSRKNAKDKYVLDGQFMAYGLVWPTSLCKTREELATTIGLEILKELGVKGEHKASFAEMLLGREPALWEEDSMRAIQESLQGATWEVGSVTLPVGMRGDGDLEYKTCNSYEKLVIELEEVARTAHHGSVPYDGGEAVFDDDAEHLVYLMMHSKVWGDKIAAAGLAE